MATDGSVKFLEYREPDVISILTLISFFLFLAIAEWLADKLLHASLIGHIVVGLIYGLPIANILAISWQETFLALGYLGLILIILEGGLTVRLDLLRQNLFLGVVAALLGVLTPIALSFALFHGAFGSSPLEVFILGTALCSTSLGTTFVLLSSASKANSNSSDPDSDATTSNDADTDCADYSQTRVGTVLVSAALLDDVCGLVLVSVIHNLRDIAGPEASVSSPESHSSPSLGWIIGRPVLASVLMALLTPAVGFFVARPVYRRFVEPRVRRLAQWAHVINIVLMAFVLGAFLAIAAYAGASVLFGSFLAGVFLSSLSAEDTASSALDDGTVPGFAATFSHYLGAAQRFIFQPLFFASVGFAIPFTELWAGEVIWKGVVYTFLMAFGKLVVGLVIPACDLLAHRRKDIDTPTRASWGPAALLGSAMVARGEIGLLIIQVGLNETPFLTHKAFAMGVWAIVLNTILGPVMVGMLLKRAGKLISTDPRWGFQAKQDVTTPAQ